MANSVQMKDQDTTSVTLKNNNTDILGTLHLDRSISWQGKPLGGSFPATIQPKGAAEFTHEKGNDPASMAARCSIVACPAPSLQRVHAVIVVWNAPGQYDPPDVPNRVYVMGSSKTSINRMSWEEILEKLKKAGSSCYNVYVDGIIDHRSPNSATLEATINLDWP